jgi:hypothetical protein
LNQAYDENLRADNFRQLPRKKDAFWHLLYIFRAGALERSIAPGAAVAVSGHRKADALASLPALEHSG